MAHKIQVVYTEHLKRRLIFRRIPYSLPEEIFHQATERFYDYATMRHIAVMAVQYRGKRRWMMIAYDVFPDRVEIVTIHPIERKQIQQRLLSGRWIYE
ncbi:MAG: hypothetical protein DRI61_13335 [Chloroflexi bacterium]|nr:MAG: hypothetical protein DRI61_13335 [Chloroflexota bacterium]HDN80446.1 hypothetical protein [Chloroflexota bacterium]